MMKSAFLRALAARRSARLTPLDLGGVRIRVPVEDYRDDLRRAARLCRTRGAAFWILSLGDNPALSGDLDRAEEAATAGDRAAARQALAVAVEANNAFSDAARLRLAALYAEAGESARAAATRHSPRVLVSVAGGYPIASQRAYRAAAVDVARDEGVELIDGGTILAALPERYLDFCHFDAEGHRLIGEALARRLERTALAARGVALPAAAVR
jgi:lysophospholipase L1-like esterase